MPTAPQRILALRIDAASDRLIRAAAKRELMTPSAYIRRAAVQAALADRETARSRARQARAIRDSGVESGEDAA